MGLLNKAMANVKKEEERGEGLLSRAGRYAREPGGAEAAGSSEGGTKTPKVEDVEKEMESMLVEPPPRPAGGDRRERKGLLRRALAVSEEQPMSKRQSRRERRRAVKAAPDARASRAPVPAEEVVPETPAAEPAIMRAGETAPDMTFDEVTSMEIPFGEEVFAGPGGPSELPTEMPETVRQETVAPKTVVPEEEGPAAEKLPVGFPDESSDELTIDVLGEFPAELDFGNEAGAAAEAARDAEAAESAAAAGGEPVGKRKGGLLAMASLFAEKEGTGERAAGRARPGARQAERPAAPGAAKTGAPKKAPRTNAKAQAAEAKRPSRAAKGQISRTEEQEALPEAAVPEEAVFTSQGETMLPETAGVPGARLPAELKDFARSLESHLSKGDALSALDLFNASVEREGHTSFILRILETMTSLGKGKSGLLFVPSKERYAVELGVPPLDKQTKLKNASFRQDSRFIQALKDCERGIFKPSGRKGDLLKKEASALGSLSPWVSVPLAVGNELVAFVVIGKQPDRPKTDEGAVALLAGLSAPYVNKYLLLKEHRHALSSLEKELKERDSLYSLYSAFESPREKLPLPERCVRELVDGIAANLGIGSAVVLADWKPKTAAGSAAQGGWSYVPVASIGVPDKALSRYRISDKDREIRSIVEAGRPSIPKDASKRKETLSRYASSKAGRRSGDGDAGAASKWPRSYVVTPLLFNGDSLGLFVVHEMKGVGKTLTQETAERLRHASRVLVPALLYGKLHSMSPFDAMRGLISSQVDEAKRNNVPLAVAVFTVENAKRACGELGFSKYWGVVERLRMLIENAAGEKGVVKDVDWNRLSLFIRENGENEVDDVIARVRTGFSGGLRKNERESGISLATLMTRYPRDSKSIEDILFSVM